MSGSDTTVLGPNASTTGGTDRSGRRRSWPVLPVSPRVVRWLTVAVLLVVLELVTFSGWLSGATAPQWDFYNQYNTEAWAWWRDGGLFSPPQWMPYAWGGYPALLDAQNSSWYLPVGLLTAVTPLTIHASAVLSALHVAFGALGAFVLLRSFRVSFVPALLGLTVWFFAAGFYSNATHLDINRAYAWMPWIILVIGGSWRWDRWWRWIAAGVILWQGCLSSYPGILVALVYVGAVYVAVTQLTRRPRLKDYLVPLAITAVGAGAMCLLRFLPLYLTRGAGSPSNDDASAFPLRMVGAFLYPYGNDTLLNDITMRSFFLAAPVFALLPFVVVLTRRTTPFIALAVAAAALGLPIWPWHEAVRSLPGMSLSRFTMSDFKPLLLLGLVLAAVSVIDRLTQRGSPDGALPTLPKRRVLGAAALGVLVCIVFAVVAVVGDYDRLGSVTQLTFLAVSVVAVWGIVLRPRAAGALGAVLIAVAAGSGLTAALATPQPWTSDRAAVEQLSFGSSVSDLMASYPAIDPDAAQRPARLAPDDVAQPAEALSTTWGRSFYTGEAAVMGYVNLKGSGPFEQINDDLFDGDERREALAFWSAPGVLIRESDSRFPTTGQMDACADSGSCGTGVEVTPDGYSTGSLRYRVSTSDTTTLVANEAFYPGWKASLCPSDAGKDCQDLPVREADNAGLRLEVPAGDWTLSLDYGIPGQTASFVAFWGGLGLLLTMSVGVEVIRRRRRPLGADPIDSGDRP